MRSRMGTKWEEEPQSGTRMGTKWEQEPQSGTRMGTKWEQEPQSGTRMRTKWEQEPKRHQRPRPPEPLCFEFCTIQPKCIDGEHSMGLFPQELERLEKCIW